MNKQIEQKARRIFAATLALTVTAGTLPNTPLSGVFGDLAITAHATNIEPTPKRYLVAEKDSRGGWIYQDLINAGTYDENSEFELEYWYKAQLIEVNDNTISDDEKRTIIEDYNIIHGDYLREVPQGQYAGTYKIDYGISETHFVAKPKSFEVIIAPEGTVIEPPEFLKPYANGGKVLESDKEVVYYDNDIYKYEKFDVVYNGQCYANSYSVMADSNGYLYIDRNNITGPQSEKGLWFAEYKKGALYVSWLGDYSVTIADSIENGTVTADKETAKKGENITLTVTPAEGYAVKSVSVNGTAINDVKGVYSFEMPDEDVTVSAEFDEALPSVTYIGEDGKEETTTYYTVLTSDITTLTSGTYVVFEDVNYTSQLKIDGYVRIILCDDKTLDVTTNDNYQSVWQKRGEGNALTIYGQEKQSGKFNAINTKGSYAFSAYAPVTINGGDITFETLDKSGCTAINNVYSLIINNGKVKTKSRDGITGNNDITINGGQVELSSLGGSGGCYNVVIGADKETDYIKFDEIYLKSYSINGYIKIADGQTLVDQNGILYSGTIKSKDDEKNKSEILAGKTFVRAYTITLPESTANGNIEVDKSYVAATDEDKTVTLTVSPDEGYQVKSIKVNDTVITPVDGVYSFTMPAEDVAVYAEFEKQKYTVKFVNYDNTELQSSEVEYGTTPAYDGETPTKASDGKYNYTFKEWSPAVTSVTGAVTYTAVYTKTPITTCFSQSGDTYTIHNEAGWDIFCDCLQDNDTYNRFSGKTVELGNNISVSRMAGSSNHDFCGTFEGNGKTLTFTSKENVNGAAPFSYVSETTPTGGSEVSNPVIRNLNVVCDITTSETHASGLVGRMWGTLYIEDCTVSGTINTSNKYACGFIGEENGTAYIKNCLSSVTINSSVDGDGTHAGFIGRTMSKTSAYIEGCVFSGKILTSKGTEKCAGFVGWNGGNVVNIKNSLYAPSAPENSETWASSDNSATFARNDGTFTNCYYTSDFNDGINFTGQGKQAYTITHGTDVSLGLSGKPTEYDVSGITVYAGNSGIKYGETTFYACSGDDVALELEYTGTPAAGYIQNGFTASAGTLSGTTLTMPAENVTINADFDVESYFNAGTLTLKGTVLNGDNGIVLPDGVNKNDVQKIDVDSSGATLPQNSSWLFDSFTNVTSIDLTGADTSSVTDMNHMFYNCESLTELDVSGFITSSVTDMNSMFRNCSKVTELDVSGFITSSVTDMSEMFGFCSKLTTIYVSNKWDAGRVTDSDYMFSGCSKLTGGNNTAYDSNHTDKTYARIDKDGQPGYLTGVYTLTLPDDLEMVTDADEDMKVGIGYLKGAEVTLRYTGTVPTGHYLTVNVNGTATTAVNGVCTITIPDSNAIVTTETIDAFDESTGTLTLKGTIFKNGQGINLPEGVEKYDVRQIVVDSSGATLPQDSSYLFFSFSNVESIDLTGADTSSVTNMGSMFSDCIGLQTIDLSGFDTSSVTNMSLMFYRCKMTELDLSGFDTSQVTYMSSMFGECKNLTTLDLSSFDTRLVNGMYAMFQNCTGLETIYVGEKWNTDSVSSNDSSYLFDGCTKLTGGSGTAYDSNYTDKTYAVIDKGGQPGYLTGVYTLTLPVNMEIVTDADEDMKVGSRYLNGAVLTFKAKTGYTVGKLEANGTVLTADENGIYTVTISDSDVTVAIAVFDESTGTLTLKGIVENGSAPQGIILPDGVSKTDVRYIVVDPAGATLPQDSSYLFNNFTSVKSIDLRGADTSKVQNMCSMFGNCRNLTSLDLSSFDTSNVTDTGWMFYHCENLTSLDLSSFNTSKVQYMDNMFYCCKNLITLDLSSFNTGIVIKMNSMFKLCSKLTTIYVSDKWDAGMVINSDFMFSGCSKLTGGNGKACDGENTIDKTYAVIDKDGQPGYLTGVYTLTLPDNMEIVTNADEDMKVGGRYLSGAALTLRYTGTVEPGYVLIVKASGTDLTEENGVYTITMPDSDVTVTAELAKLITPDMVTLSGEGFEDNRFIHDGSEKTVTVTVKDGDKTLAEGTDYTVSGNTGTETGSYTLTVTGIGDYTGAFVNFWKIVSGNVSITYETPVESTTVTAQVGQMMKIIAPETDDGGKNFAYWQDADGKIISYSSDYRFIVKKPMVLTAVYAEVSEPVKVLILEAAKASHDGKNNVCLTFDRSIPYDQDIIGAGIIYTTNKLLGDSTNTEDLRSKDGFGSDSIIAALKARGTNVIVDNFDETSCNGTINVYIPVGNNTDAYIYAIAYVASENGDETVYDYSELVAATYNTAAEM